MTHIANCHVPTARPYTAFTACGQVVRTRKIVETQPSCPVCEDILLDFLAYREPIDRPRPEQFVRRKKRTQ